MGGTYRIRTAESSAEKVAAFRLRYELYVAAQGLFMAQADHAERQLTDAHDASSDIFLAEADGELVGTFRCTWGAVAPFSRSVREATQLDVFRDLVEQRDIALGTYLAVDPAHRRQGLGPRLIGELCEYMARRDIELLVAYCRPRLARYYWRLGFRPYGRLYHHPTNGVRVPIVLVAGDLEHLSHVGSPLLEPLSRCRAPACGLDRLRSLLECEKPPIDFLTTRNAEGYRRETMCRLAESDLRSVLERLDPVEIDALVERCYDLRCEAGQPLWRARQYSQTAFVLLEGTLHRRIDLTIIDRLEQPGAVVGAPAVGGWADAGSAPPAARQTYDLVAGPRGARVLGLPADLLTSIPYALPPPGVLIQTVNPRP